MDDDDIIWQVVFCADTIGKGVVRGMYKTLEAAQKKREELVKKQEYEDSFDIYRYDNHWEYYVRGISVREHMNERKAIYDKLMTQAFYAFWSHCDEHFEECCRWVLERVRDRFTEKPVHHMYWGRLFSPWQIFHGEARVLAFLHTEDQKSLTLTGIFLAPDKRIDKDIRQFESKEVFLEWIGNFDDAVTEFVHVMRERRYKEYEKYLLRPC